MKKISYTPEERKEIARDIMKGDYSLQNAEEEKEVASSTISKWIRDEIRSMGAHDDNAVFLGNVYANGYGVKQSDRTAVSYYETAAKNGDTEGMYRLGTAFYLGRGAARNYEEAYAWLKKASDGEHSGAMVYLGYIHANGHGVPKNYVKSVMWYQKAADLGNTEAKVNLGIMYIQGRGVSRDADRARQLFEEAADKGNTEAMLNLAHMYGNNKQYDEAEGLLRKAASLDNVEAMVRIGKMYKDGYGQIPVNYGNAAGFFRKAAEHGREDALLPLAECYQRLAECGDGNAMLELGRMYYYHKRGIPQDYARAAKWFELAAEKDNATAMGYLGLMYANGRGVTMDKDISDAWYKKMFLLRKNEKVYMDFDDAEILESLGDIYTAGELVEKNIADARKCYYVADSYGSADAMQKLQPLLNIILPGDFSDAKDVGYDKVVREKIDAVSKLFQRAGKSYAKGDYGAALVSWENASELGSIAALNHMGWLYYDGLGTEQDYGKAMELFLRAADRGSSAAMNYIGDMYKQGIGVEPDKDEARRWYEKADKTDSKASMHFIATHHYKKVFKEDFFFNQQDYSSALQRYLQKAKNGDTASMNRVGRIYYYSFAGQLDHNASLDWFMKAANLGDAAAMKNVSDYFNDLLMDHYDHNKSEEWRKKALEAGFDAMSECALCVHQ